MRAIYPGTFDPVTKGHIDIIERALKLFDGIVIALPKNQSKKCMFSVGERIEMIRKVTKGMNVEVEGFSGLLVDFAKKKHIKVVVRGLRALSDFEFEFQMAIMNRDLGSLESVFLMTEKEYFYLSSSVVRDIAEHGGDASRFVPRFVAEKLEEKYRR